MENKIPEKAVWSDLPIVPHDQQSTAFGHPSQPQIIFCYRCGMEIPPDSEFCPSCGIQLYLVCPKCNCRFLSKYSYCPKCGTNREFYLTEEKRKQEQIRQQQLEEDKKAREIELARVRAAEEKEYERERIRQEEERNRLKELEINKKIKDEINSQTRLLRNKRRNRLILIVCLSLLVFVPIMITGFNYFLFENQIDFDGWCYSLPKCIQAGWRFASLMFFIFLPLIIAFVPTILLYFILIKLLRIRQIEMQIENIKVNVNSQYGIIYRPSLPHRRDKLDFSNLLVGILTIIIGAILFISWIGITAWSAVGVANYMETIIQNEIINGIIFMVTMLVVGVGGCLILWLALDKVIHLINI